MLWLDTDLVVFSWQWIASSRIQRQIDSCWLRDVLGEVISVAPWLSASALNRLQSLACCLHVFIASVSLSVIYNWPLFSCLSSSIDSWGVIFLDCHHKSPEFHEKKVLQTQMSSLLVLQQLWLLPFLHCLHTMIGFCPLRFLWQPSWKDLMENGHRNLVHLNPHSHIKTQWGSYLWGFFIRWSKWILPCRLSLCSFLFTFFLFSFCFHLQSVVTLGQVCNTARGKQWWRGWHIFKW